MKKTIKLLPVVACLALLTGCDNTIKLAKNGRNSTIVNVENATVNTNEDIFEKLYDASGIDTTIKNILVEIADYVLDNSDFWNTKVENKTLKQRQLEFRVQEKFDEFYKNSEFKKNGLFQEKLLVEHLREDGYSINLDNQLVYFNEDFGSNYVGYNHLLDKLNKDVYADYIKSVEKDLKIDLLKEEYVRTKTAVSSGSEKYYNNKDVRQVQYFSYSPADSSERTEYRNIFQGYIDANLALDTPKDFKEVVTGVGGLEEQWKIKQLKELAKEFAIINFKAKEGGYEGINDLQGDYPLPAVYAEAAKEAELEYANSNKYGYKDISTKEAEALLQENEVTEARSAWCEYSSEGTQSIYQGYYEKQLAIINSNYYTTVDYTTSNSSVIDSTVTDVLEDFDTDHLYKGETAGDYIEVYEGSLVYRNGSTCYIIFANKVVGTVAEMNANPDSCVIALRQLAKSSSNIKNFWNYYLEDLTDNNKFSVHIQEIYDYLNTTYSYGVDD